MGSDVNEKSFTGYMGVNYNYLHTYCFANFIIVSAEHPAVSGITCRATNCFLRQLSSNTNEQQIKILFKT